nr:MAG TPA: hypothetical protein [Crassvirales sp.]DAH00092.1 MAG TPA: hypothetical protein [Crassvirales sp.]
MVKASKTFMSTIPSRGYIANSLGYKVDSTTSKRD